jgi:hypothetical protein
VRPADAAWHQDEGQDEGKDEGQEEEQKEGQASRNSFALASKAVS